MSKRYAGSCLCGEVRFEISGAFEHFFLCHCDRCRKDTGSAHAANLFSTTAAITWLSGQENARTFQVPSSRHRKSFCSKCGSALPDVQFDGGLLVVPAGSLDVDIDIEPNAHIFFAERANWDEQLEAAPKIDGLPG
ncbi:Uncharacterized conserved protein [Kaistia soli DSM 19436]|uniref:Uncharacterized conserved protein n=1 Tax=Kaistia soli DSM 19436 TaxID=1122133 RepID=A0A1M5AJS0_9HYPH|nr:GFA family protein [Kaistia soli]SHF30519.1 Uncharacterized conserved protein [Kaistia soli DSM 19436]